jgi:hypothetical protein
MHRRELRLSEKMLGKEYPIIPIGSEARTLATTFLEHLRNDDPKST